MKKIIFYISMLILFMAAVVLIWENTKFKVDKDLSKLNLDGVENLMIVAHPDDDMLWGGAHLIKDKYLVVCITCGVNNIRVSEFKKVMARVEDEYIMLGWPDLTKGQIDDWDTSREGIIEDLEKIINLKDWKQIVVHNPEGEYGHKHHQMASKFTTDLVVDKSILYYFGHYYKKKDLPAHVEGLVKMDDEILNEKEDIMKLYYSQTKVIKNSNHFHAYENWLSYDEWMNEGNV